MYCLLSLPFLSLDIFLWARRSWQCFLSIDISCEGPFSENFYSWNGYNLFIMFHSLCFLLFFSQKIRFFQNVFLKHITDHSIASSSLNCRQGIYLENLVYNMIWQIKEKEDIVKLACFLKNWTRYEFHIISKLLLTTNVPPKERKGINQRESWNLAKEAIIGLNAEKH